MSEVIINTGNPTITTLSQGGILPGEPIPGPPGPEGKSAYQIALDNGFVGTEAEWLETLVGPEGPEGPQGDVGPDGPAGPGIAAGGTAGQVLEKASNADYDTRWVSVQTNISGMTTDATPTKIGEVAIPSGTSNFTVSVTGHGGDNSHGSTIFTTVRNVSGDIVGCGAMEVPRHTQATITWSVTTQVNDATDMLEVWVTGEANQNITWEGAIRNG